MDWEYYYKDNIISTTLSDVLIDSKLTFFIRFNEFALTQKYLIFVYSLDMYMGEY